MSQVVFAVITAVAIILTLTTILFVVGPIVDKFQYKISNLDVTWEGESTYPKMAQVSANMFNWFFAVPVFFMYFFIVWMFKVVIWKHLYSKGEQERYYEI